MEDQKIQQPTQKNNNDVEENKAIAALAYLNILCFIPLLTKKESEFAQFHAKQGLVIFIVEVIAMFIILIPFIGWIIGWIIFSICGVASIYGIINAINGQKKEIPGVTEIAKKLNI